MSEAPRRHIKRLQKLNRNSLESLSGSGAKDTAGRGRTESGVKIHTTKQKRKNTVHTVEVGYKGSFYSPGELIAENLRKALSPDHDHMSPSQGTTTGVGGPCIRTKGKVLELTERGGAKVQAYGAEVWLKAKWVEDLNDGSIRISSVAFQKTPYLRHIRKKHQCL